MISTSDLRHGARRSMRGRRVRRPVGGHAALAASGFILLLLGACAPSARVSALPTATVEAPVGGATPAPPPALPGASQEGMASWYGPGFVGRTTASGETFDPSRLTAAHRTLPFGTRVRVTNVASGQSVEVRINDRGPFRAGRIIDLSRAAAEGIGMVGSGVARVRLEVVSGVPGRAKLAGGGRLSGFEALSTTHPPGQLLVLRSQRSPDPVLVRVVPGEFPIEADADLIVADELYLALGPEVAVAFD